VAISLIVGLPRQGKTLFCVKKIIAYLEETDRHIYTNLPLNPDRLVRQIVKGGGRNPLNQFDEYRSYLRRIHLFKSFSSRADYVKFRKKNPLWLREVRAVKDDFLNVSPVDAFSDVRRERFLLEYQVFRLFIPLRNIVTFWIYHTRNAVGFYDEIYQFFNSIDYKDRTKDDLRRQLQLYNNQHGHYSDDLYLIAHVERQIDANIRDVVMYTYKCINSKYRNIIPESQIKKRPLIMNCFRGLKHMFQFFIVEGYQPDATVPSDEWTYRADPALFECYESQSTAENLKGKLVQARSEDESSLDFNMSRWDILLNWVRQAWPHWIVLAAVISFFGLVAYNVLRLLAHDDKSKSSAPVSAPSPVSASSSAGTAPPGNSKTYKIRAVTSNMVLFDDGFRIKRGDDYEGFKVLSVGRDVCVLERGGKRYTVRTDGVRK